MILQKNFGIEKGGLETKQAIERLLKDEKYFERISKYFKIKITMKNRILNLAFLSILLLFSSNNSLFAYGTNDPKLNRETKFVDYQSTEMPLAEGVENDTVTTNSIVNIWNSNDAYNVKVALKDKDSEIDIAIYNMLGKEVLKVVQKGIQTTDEAIYEFNVSKLPNGVYLCVLIGRNFRDVEKFIISR
ncbi:MAG: hypothetical protein CVV22_01305 [Ignavibacteriae bacterium HGW-Ignavibacteriae-1]|jgi:hypothetical protein|nr:MAG: hypothetical protein CVV22_01305 [Ignavibacteriae bacterium HGW-Ignavibacteriae-1]